MKKVFVFTFIVLSLLSVESFGQCAMCRATVESNLSEGRGTIGTGLNFGILYLLSTPYILVAALIFFWIRVGRKELKARQELENRLSEIYKK
ncbi:hypothetical protein EGI26_11415 [Lacihabitans sp. CCS-44]|uniref:hypothetical protein n=1 Tax=Lacihabitans sp. CCS-44 TaxID=2487331 RepID=UPI0020CEFB86|nr:hypothetical protein [Lacihabitans sp. CCS-44]MCP9755764.1 hypothetical protein [Lacihabitans sp. CCS-44]